MHPNTTYRFLFLRRYPVRDFAICRHPKVETQPLGNTSNPSKLCRVEKQTCPDCDGMRFVTRTPTVRSYSPWVRR